MPVPPPTILVYHTVDDYGGRSLPAGIDCPPKVFADHVHHLARHFTFVSVADVVAHYRNGVALPPRAVALTFDDGYRDNFVHAVPILRAHGATATFFCVTAHLDGTWPAEDWGGTGRPMLTRTDIAAMASEGFSFGSHGHTHAVLTELSDERLADELSASKRILEDASNTAVTTMSFPFGAFDARVQQAAEHAGYEAAFAVWTPHE